MLCILGLYIHRTSFSNSFFAQERGGFRHMSSYRVHGRLDSNGPISAQGQRLWELPLPPSRAAVHHPGLPWVGSYGYIPAVALARTGLGGDQRTWKEDNLMEIHGNPQHTTVTSCQQLCDLTTCLCTFCLRLLVTHQIISYHRLGHGKVDERVYLRSQA